MKQRFPLKDKKGRIVGWEELIVRNHPPHWAPLIWAMERRIASRVAAMKRRTVPPVAGNRAA